MHLETGARTFADEVVGDDLGRNARLERIHAAIDWDRIGAIVGELHSSGEGRRAYPPLVMLKAMLLQHLHDLGDPKLEERLNNDLSWRRFVGLGFTDGTPDHTTISRFRSLLVERGLMRRIFEAVNAQLDEKGMILRRGTVVDATLVQAQARRPAVRRRRGRRGEVEEVEQPDGPGRRLGPEHVRLQGAPGDRPRVLAGPRRAGDAGERRRHGHVRRAGPGGRGRHVRRRGVREPQAHAASGGDGDRERGDAPRQQASSGSRR